MNTELQKVVKSLKKQMEATYARCTTAILDSSYTEAFIESIVGDFFEHEFIDGIVSIINTEGENKYNILEVKWRTMWRGFFVIITVDPTLDTQLFWKIEDYAKNLCGDVADFHMQEDTYSYNSSCSLGFTILFGADKMNQLYQKAADTFTEEVTSLLGREPREEELDEIKNALYD